MTPKTLNEWRVIPRLLVALYGVLFYTVSDWFMGLDDPTNAQAAFVSTVVGAGAAIFNFYCSTGAKE